MARDIAQRRAICFGWFATVLTAATDPVVVVAQSVARKVPRIGVLGVTSAAGYARQIAAMHQGFRDLGYVEGQNIGIGYRWADGRYEQLPALAAELIRLQPDALITSGPGTRVLKDATATIPIVMAVAADAVADGLVESLARPGGNITGSTFFGPELSAKRLELLKDAVPQLGKVAILLNPQNRSYRVDLAALKKAASVLNVELLECPQNLLASSIAPLPRWSTAARRRSWYRVTRCPSRTCDVWASSPPIADCRAPAPTNSAKEVGRWPTA